MPDSVITGLLYTKPRVYKVIGIIKNYLKNINIVRYPEIEIVENPPTKDNECGEIDLHIPLTRELNGKFNSWLNLSKGFDEDDFCFSWERALDDKRYWFLSRSGRPLCFEESHWGHIINLEKGYSECSCPKDFHKVCKDLTFILLKNVNKKGYWEG